MKDSFSTQIYRDSNQPLAHQPVQSHRSIVSLENSKPQVQPSGLNLQINVQQSQTILPPKPSQQSSVRNVRISLNDLKTKHIDKKQSLPKHLSTQPRVSSVERNLQNMDKTDDEIKQMYEDMAYKSDGGELTSM